jgi:hypothetical protein
MSRRVVIALILATLCSWSAYAAPTLTVSLIPANGAISGSRGQTVGWGFTITNNTSFWIIITGSFFCGIGGDPNFTDCSNGGGSPNPYAPYDGSSQFGTSFGPYSDYTAAPPHFIELQPSGSGGDTFGPQSYSQGNPGNGVGQYMILPSAPIGMTDTGNIFITFDEYSGDPLENPDRVGSDEGSAAASVTIVPTPEPATFLLVGGALVALARLRRRVGQASRPV